VTKAGAIGLTPGMHHIKTQGFNGGGGYYTQTPNPGSTAEREGTTEIVLKTFVLKMAQAKAIIWPWLA